MGERFKIHNPEDTPPPKKTFIIHPSRPKTFIIKEQSEAARTASDSEWFKQQNTNDCGPCLLLNSINALGIENAPRSVEEMRAEVNAIRRAANARELAPTDWFTTDDLNRFFLSRGFSVTGYSGDPGDREAQDSVVRSVNTNLEKSFDLIYTTFPGSHYRGVIPKADQEDYELLDSFSNAPQTITKMQVEALVSETLNAPKRRTGQLEAIGIVRRMQRGE
ncbi:MAG: hypothetical protein V4438_02660 [Patescibacteria group bacterium]